MASEATPLLPLVKDDEATAQLRDRVTTSYTTIALVSALLSAVSFAAYATPPSAIFTAAATATPPAPPPTSSPPSLVLAAAAPATNFVHSVDKWFVGLVHDGGAFQEALDIFMEILWHIYGIVMPLAFVCNLAGTLAASGVILYANSTLASGASIRRLFGKKESEHAIMKYPAACLVLGVVSLFVGFCIGICLYYGLGVAIITGVAAGIGALIYEKCFAHSSHSDTFNALNVSLGALFFRSCLPDVARQADEHPAAEADMEGGAGGLSQAAAEAAAAEEAEEAEREERERAAWDERAEAIGKAVAAELRAEPVTVRRDPRDETRDFSKKKGCC